MNKALEKKETGLDMREKISEYFYLLYGVKWSYLNPSSRGFVLAIEHERKHLYTLPTCVRQVCVNLLAKVQ